MISEPNPPRWAERWLAAVLPANDRDCIVGDLLEEYREVALPSRGPVAGYVWYIRQVISVTCDLVPYCPGGVVNSLTLGSGLGVALSALIVLTNVVIPVLPSTLFTQRLLAAVPESVGWLGLFLSWGIAGSLVSRRTTRLRTAVEAGATVAFVSMAMVMLTFVVMNNVFLEIVGQQPDKIWGFHHSSDPNMRAYINHGARRGIVFILPILTVCGGVAAGVASLLRRVRGTSR